VIKTNESVANAIKEVKVIEFVNNGIIPIKVAIAKSDVFVNRSMFLGKIMDHSNVDLAIAFTIDGKVRIRSRSKDTDPVDSIKLSSNGIARVHGRRWS
jgi:hypothetical protein